MKAIKECNLADRNTFYASDSLLEEAKEVGANVYVNLAYTAYGGTFLDNCIIQYFKEFHPESIIFESTSWNGENAFIFGEMAQKFLDETTDYYLGFEDLDDYFINKLYDCKVNGLKELGYNQQQINIILDNVSVSVQPDGSIDVNTNTVDIVLNDSIYKDI